MFLIRLIVMAVMLAILSKKAGAADLIVFTEHVPPYSFTTPDGQVVGSATERVRRFLGSLPISYEIRQVPWNRAYELSKQLDNALVYPIMRLPSREHDYHWLIEVEQSDLYIYGRVNEGRTVTPEALRRGDFTAVCVIGDAACELFSSMGVPKAKILEVAYDQRIELRIIQSGRGDVFIAQEEEFRELAIGADPAIGKLMRLDGNVQFCLAASGNMRSDFLVLLQDAGLSVNKRLLPTP